MLTKQPKNKNLSRSQCQKNTTNNNNTNNKENHKITRQIKKIIETSNIQNIQKAKKNRPQSIPQKLIQKNRHNHKYLYKKSLINTKFQWLNKYLQNSQLQPLSAPLKHNKISYSYLKDRQSRILSLHNRHAYTENIKQENYQDYEQKVNVFESYQYKKYEQANRKRSKTQGVENLYSYDYEQRKSNMKNTKFLNHHNNYVLGNNNSTQNIKVDPSQSLQLLRQFRNNKSNCLNKYPIQQKHSNSMKQNYPHIFGTKQQAKFHPLMFHQRKKNFSQVLKSSIQKIIDTQQEINDKQNLHHKLHNPNNRKTKKNNIYDSPFQQILVDNSSSHTNLTSLKNIIKNKSYNHRDNNRSSGCIKNRKKQYLFLSKQSKIKNSSIMRKYIQDEINIEPWNFNQNNYQNQNYENQFNNGKENNKL